MITINKNRVYTILVSGINDAYTGHLVDALIMAAELLNLNILIIQIGSGNINEKPELINGVAFRYINKYTKKNRHKLYEIKKNISELYPYLQDSSCKNWINYLNQIHVWCRNKSRLRLADLTSQLNLSWDSDWYDIVMGDNIVATELHDIVNAIRSIVLEVDLVAVSPCSESYISPTKFDDVYTALLQGYEGGAQGVLDLTTSIMAIREGKYGIGTCNGAQMGWLASGGTVEPLNTPTSGVFPLTVMNSHIKAKYKKMIDKGTIRQSKHVAENVTSGRRHLYIGQNMMRVCEANINNQNYNLPVAKEYSHVGNFSGLREPGYYKPGSDNNGLEILKEYDHSWAMVAPGWVESMARGCHTINNKTFHYLNEHYVTESLHSLFENDATVNTRINDLIEIQRGYSDQHGLFIDNLKSKTYIEAYRINNYFGTQYHPESGRKDHDANICYFLQIMEYSMPK